MIKRKSVQKIDKNGEAYQYFTAKPYCFKSSGIYYIQYHGTTRGKSRDWVECIKMYNSKICEMYITRDNILTSYTAPFMDLDSPEPKDITIDMNYRTVQPVKRCRQCDRWFSRGDLSRNSNKCPECLSGASTPSKDSYKFIDYPDAPDEWKQINQHTARKLTHCKNCGKKGEPKRLNSSKHPIRHHKLCPDCWVELVFLARLVLSVIKRS